MKLTAAKLKQIIKEEIKKVLREKRARTWYTPPKYAPLGVACKEWSNEDERNCSDEAGGGLYWVDSLGKPTKGPNMPGSLPWPLNTQVPARLGFYNCDPKQDFKECRDTFRRKWQERERRKSTKRD